jgi:hypothetical protein
MDIAASEKNPFFSWLSHGKPSPIDSIESSRILSSGRAHLTVGLDFLLIFVQDPPQRRKGLRSRVKFSQPDWQTTSKDRRIGMQALCPTCPIGSSRLRIGFLGSYPSCP